MRPSNTTKAAFGTAILAFMAIAALNVCRAQTPKTWTGLGGNGDWFTPANWSSGVLPEADDDVRLFGGITVTLSGPTPALRSFVITNATLVFTNWNAKLEASDIILEKNGVLTLPNAFTDDQMSNRVHLVCVNFTMNAGAAISVEGRGYAGAPDYNASGYGPGKGIAGSGTYYLSGAGHGGMGGNGSNGGQAGAIYDEIDEPVAPGSGGAGSGGGRGGGAVLIDASGAAIINGVINADATKGTPYGGGGAGGSILVFCRTLEGSSNALLSAAGGNGGANNGGGGGGGGGRIAIHYDPIEQALLPCPKIRMSVANGLRTHTSYNCENGDPGTVYFPDSLLLSETPCNLLNVRLHGFASWSPNQLAMTNCAIWFAEEGFALNVAGDVLCDQGARLSLPAHSVLDCGGNLILREGGNMSVYGGRTNETHPKFGAFVNVVGVMQIGASSTVKVHSAYAFNRPDGPPMQTNLDVAAPFFSVNSLVVDYGGNFNADGLGFSGGLGITDAGFGPGKGTCASYYGGGAGHGGMGGKGSNGNGGPAYDSLEMPLQPGSGAGGTWAGAGGGAIFLKAAEQVEINGLVSADGASGLQHGGGGSGGSILIKCRKFIGDAQAKISATGGKPGTVTSASGGAGGGGRVAIWFGRFSQSQCDSLAEGVYPPGIAVEYTLENFSGTITATNGINPGKPQYDGFPGTIIYIHALPPPGTIANLH